MTPGGYSAVILAGGAGRRLGGAAKPSLPVGGRPMLARVIGAVIDASIRVVVGPALLRPILPNGVRLTQEEPSGGGPVAGLAAGLSVVRLATGSIGPGEPTWTALLAADLPLLTPDAIDLLLTEVGSNNSTVDGSVYVDGDGRPQWLCGVWRTEALHRRLSDLGSPEGRALRGLLSGLRYVQVTAPTGPPPWHDCDTPTDVRRAEEWIG